MKAVAIFLTCLCACELPLNGTGPEDLPGLPPTATRDAEAPRNEAAALPPNSDQAQVAVCHSTAPWGQGGAASLDALDRVHPPCKSYSATSSINDPNTVAYVNNCQIVPAPVECSTCVYTCDCILRYTELPDAGCTCSQSTPGGVIVISGC
jgi:hypothetical protein